MRITTFPDDPRPSWREPVAALGNFDGMHRGHMRLFERVRRQAGERGGTPVAVTFDPHPSRVLRPDKAPPLLMTLEQKLDGFERAGMHGAVIVRFTPELALWEPEHFVERVLIDWLRVSEVWVGANFLFGRKGPAPTRCSARSARTAGFAPRKSSPCGTRTSSSRARGFGI